MSKIKNKAREDGRVKSKIYIGNGKYKYVYAANNKELAEKVQEIKLKLGKGLDVSADDDTFGYWSDRWIELKKMDVSDKRWRSYNSRRHYFDELAFIPIEKIKLAQIQQVIVDCATKPTAATGKPLARQSLIDLKNIASQIFKLAIANRITDFNPAETVKIPKGMAKETRQPLSEEQQRWVREMPHRAQIAAMIMLYAGLRRGELMALTWSDIDLNERLIVVNKAVVYSNNVGKVVNSTKTESGMRTVYIPDTLVEYLKTQPRTTFLVTCKRDGTIHSETSWKRMWESYMTALNVKYGDFGSVIGRLPKKLPMLIPTFTPHQLRHTYVTMLYLAGVDVLTAKEQAGHADIKTTLGIYTHLDKTHKINSIEKLNKFISSDGGQMGVKIKSNA